MTFVKLLVISMLVYMCVAGCFCVWRDFFKFAGCTINYFGKKKKKIYGLSTAAENVY